MAAALATLHISLLRCTALPQQCASCVWGLTVKVQSGAARQIFCQHKYVPDCDYRQWLWLWLWI